MSTQAAEIGQVEAVASAPRWPAAGTGGRLRTWVASGVLAMVALGVAAEITWIYAGTGRWEALPEREGVKVYYLKIPGTTLMQYKAVGRFRAALRNIVSFMRDPTVCDDVGCVDSRVLEKIDSRHEYQTFTYRYPAPFKPRQFVVIEQVSQDPVSRQVTVEYLGTPYKIPPDDCCVRVPRMNNKWKFAPRADGSVDVEFLIDNYEGGFMPAFVSNYFSRESAYEAPAGLAMLLTQKKYIDKYSDVPIDYINESVSRR